MDNKTTAEVCNAIARVAFHIATTSAKVAPSARMSRVPFSNMRQEDWRRAANLWREHGGKPLQNAPGRGCPACGAQESRKLFESYDNHAFHECNDCRCWFTPKIVDGRLFEEFFELCPEARPLAVAMTEGRNEQDMEKADVKRIGGYLDEIIPLLSGKLQDPIRYLDVGCGVGHSLRAANARGLSSCGIEADHTAVGTARRDGLPVLSINDPMPSGPFHILSFWETLEHIHDPLAALTEPVKLLAANGLLAITIPNLNASAIRILREDCSYVFGGYNTPGHINLFHLPAIQRLFDRLGLHILDADGQYSNNPIELLSHLSGGNRGARDILEDQAPKFQLQEDTESFINNVWPAAVLLERLTLTSPILKILACKKESADLFADAVSKMRSDRFHQIATSATQLTSNQVVSIADSSYRAPITEISYSTRLINFIKSKL